MANRKLPRFLTYSELAEEYGITEIQVSNIIDVLDFGKDIEKYENGRGRTLVSQSEFEPLVNEWKTERRRGRKPAQSAMEIPEELIPIGRVMKECGLSGNDHGLYFKRYAEDRTRKPMTLTATEAKRMKHDYIGFPEGEQLTIDEPGKPIPAMTLAEYFELGKTLFGDFSK